MALLRKSHPAWQNAREFLARDLYIQGWQSIDQRQMKHSLEAEGDAPTTSRETLGDLRVDSGTRESDHDASSESLKAFKQSLVDMPTLGRPPSSEGVETK